MTTEILSKNLQASVSQIDDTYKSKMKDMVVGEMSDYNKRKGFFFSSRKPASKENTTLQHFNEVRSARVPMDAPENDFFEKVANGELSVNDFLNTKEIKALDKRIPTLTGISPTGTFTKFSEFFKATEEGVQKRPTLDL